MKGRHDTFEQVSRKLAEGEKLLGQGQSLAEVVRHLRSPSRPAIRQALRGHRTACLSALTAGLIGR